MTHEFKEEIGTLKEFLSHCDKTACTHEDRYRGGAIWTICYGCGKKWSDDRDPYVPYRESEFVKEGS